MIGKGLLPSEPDDHECAPGREVPPEAGEGLREREMVKDGDAGDDVVGAGGIPTEASATVNVTASPGSLSSRALASISGSESMPCTSAARLASSRARSPVPHPTSRARPKRRGSRRSSQGW